MVFVVPWVMLAIRKDEYSASIIGKLTPFIGFVFLFACVRYLLTIKRQNGIFNVGKFTILLILALITPIVPYAAKMGFLIQFSYPFLNAEDAFGLSYYKNFDIRDVVKFLIGGVAIPVLTHAWIPCLFCLVVSVLQTIIQLLGKILCRKGKKTAVKNEEKTD
ncbi:Hypothetical_protein [Hexamita inflata]|uniref:Hypothetical_protein n=1 Tax=Hexamita inflata TaxID=28002 RepID=A0AA86NFJ6_9EUKA|nr:Hypothetical protein HINF_LOCUS5869 [Hexamita inflata]